MSQESNYAETTCDKIIRLLKDWDRGNYFEEFYYGDPGEIPTDHQPCVFVDLLNSTVEQGPTSTDLVVETIKIGLVLNKKTYMTNNNDDEVTWKKKLELMIQGNNPVTGQYDPTTILGVLRTNFTMGNYALNQKMDIKYGDVPRNGFEEDPTGEAHVIMTVDHFQLTPAKV